MGMKPTGTGEPDIKGEFTMLTTFRRIGLVALTAVLVLGVAAPAYAPPMPTGVLTADARWRWVNPVPTGGPYGALDFITADEGWATTTDGAILHTSNGGLSWELQAHLGAQIIDIAMKDGSTGLVITRDPDRIYRTTSGGDTWAAVHSSSSNLNAAHWATNTVAIVAADNGRYLKSTNSGASWTSQATGFTDNLLCAWFEGASVGWFGTSDGNVLRTTNGSTWTRSTAHSGRAITSIAFATNSIGIASWQGAPEVDNGGMLRTTNGGANWTDKGLEEGDVEFVDSTNGWFFTYNNAYATADAGANWTPVTGAVSATRSSAVNALIAVADGWQSAPQITTDGGDTWTNTGHRIVGLGPQAAYADPAHAWSYGWDMIYEYGLIGTSADGGNSWNIGSFPGNTERDAAVVDADHVWLATDNGVVLATANGGSSWTTQTVAPVGTVGAPLDLIEFTDLTHGWTLDEDRRLFRTVNGGGTWTPVATPGAWSMMDMDFASSTTGWICGQANDGSMLWKTTDAGSTWTTVTIPPFDFESDWPRLWALDVISTTDVWAAGDPNVIVHTTNGGATWSDTYLDDGTGTMSAVLDIDFTTPQHGMAVFMDRVFETWNGGSTWVSHAKPGMWLGSVAMGDDDTALSLSHLSDTLVKTPIVRHGGRTRYDTACQLSSADTTSSNVVLLASGVTFADALAAAPLAHEMDVPLLLTDTYTLPTATVRELQRLGANQVVLIGGTQAIGTGVVNQLAALGFSGGEVTRIYGADRYATAAAIADRWVIEHGGYPETVYVASGTAFADAVCAASAAAVEGSPLLLTATSSIPAATAAEIADLGPTTCVVAGGPLVVTPGVLAGLPGAIRVSGANRYATSVALADRALAHGASLARTYVATGANFPDALAAGPVAARNGGVIVLTAKDKLPLETEVFLQTHGADVDRLTIVGDSGVITDAVARLMYYAIR